MARIAGVDLPREKRVEIGLTYIFGIGLTTSQQILRETGINPDTRVRNLTEEEVVRLREYIDRNLKVEGDLRREVEPEHQAAHGDRLLSRPSPPPRPSGPRSAHAHERAHPQGSASPDRREEEGQVSDGSQEEDRPHPR